MEGWSREIQRSAERMIIQVARMISQVFGYTNTAQSSSLGDKDYVETSDDDVDPDDKTKGQRPVTRITPFGFQSRQPNGLRSLWLRLSSKNIFFIGIAPTKSYGPDSLDVGETALYCGANGTIVKLDKNGNIIITPASGQTVQIGGSSHPLPLWDTFEADLKNALTIINTAGVAPPGGGTVTYTDPSGFIAKLISGLGGVPSKIYESAVGKNG